MAQAHVPRLRVLDRLPRPARPRLHAQRSGGDQAADQAAVRLVPALPRVDHAALPRARRRRRHEGLREDLQVHLPGAEQEAARRGSRAPGQLRRLPRPEDHGAARDAAGLHPRHPGAGRVRRAGAAPALDRAVARRASAREAVRPERRRHAQRDALVRLRPVPRRVLLRDQDAAHLPVGQGPHASRTIEAFWNETKFPDGEPFYDYAARGDRRARAQGAAPGVRAVEPGHPRAQRRRLRRLPHALHARGRHQGQRPLGAQPAAQRQPRLPDLPPRLRRRDQGARRRDPERNYELAAARRRGHRRADRRHRRGEEGGRDRAQLAAALELQRKAQWRLDFIAAENSMGFHAPQEAARVLGEAIDYARQGQLAVLHAQSRAGGAVASVPVATAK